MIVDRFENWERYFQGEIGMKVLSFICGLNENSADTEMEPVLGDEIKARVMTYHTKDISEVVFEAHKKYIDIQFTLSGEEGIGWVPEVMARIKTEYNPESDAGFYTVSSEGLNVIWNVPGQFMVLFPGEVHGAGVRVGNVVKAVKKCVVKIDWQAYVKSELGKLGKT